MATRHLEYTADQFIPVSTGGCKEVYLCLKAPWASRLVDGPFLKATISNGRFLGSAGSPYAPRFENPRGEAEYMYTLQYDSAAFINDPGTGQPYVLPCSAIAEVNPYVCSLDALLAAIV
jgi:hypothetical protein